jgi:methionyl-tRNA synthetase
MTTSPKNILVAVAWPYANGLSHIGHIAGAYLPADVFARYHRIAGNRVLMVSGSDAHGTPITVKADQEGVTPADIVDRYHPRFLEQWEALGISFDNFTSTMTETHREVVQEMFLRLRDNGYLETRTTEQFYDPRAERFLPDRYVEGTCPNCAYEAARGDQCDHCGKTLDPTDLIDPRSKFSGATPEPRETEHYFILLSKLQDDVLAYLEAQQDAGWRNHVLNWALGFVRGGLHDRAITRDMTWGVPIPESAAIDARDDKRIYVWFEAVIGYLSAAVEWSRDHGTPDAYKEWWENPDAETYYFIGKDNIPFHAVYWPGQLMAYNAGGGAALNLPTNVPANQYVTFKGAKASKSMGIGTPVLDYLDTFSPDALRYAIAANLPEYTDTDISTGELARRVNEELANGWGNLVNRVLSMTNKNFDGLVPAAGALSDPDRELIATVDRLLAEEAELLERVELRQALKKALTIAQEANAYLNALEPWKTAKSDLERTATTLNTALQAISAGVVAFAPFTPFSSEQVHGWLGGVEDLAGHGWRRREVTAGTALGIPTPLFPKIELPDPDGA